MCVCVCVCVCACVRACVRACVVVVVVVVCFVCLFVLGGGGCFVCLFWLLWVCFIKFCLQAVIAQRINSQRGCVGGVRGRAVGRG